MLVLRRYLAGFLALLILQGSIAPVLAEYNTSGWINFGADSAADVSVDLLAPTDSAVTRITDTTLDITWTDNSAGEAGYKIERADDDAGSPSTWAEIGTAAADATSYSDSGLTADTTYHYRIRTYNGLDNSAYSSEIQITTALTTLIPDSTDHLAYESTPADPTSTNLADFRSTGFDAAAYTSIAADDADYKVTTATGDAVSASANVAFTTAGNYTVEDSANVEITSGAASLKNTGTPYSISNAALFDGSTGYLSKTLSAGNTQTFTWSSWVQLSALSGGDTLFGTSMSASNPDNIVIDGNRQLGIFKENGNTWAVKTAAVLRDTSDFAHVVVSIDTTQATASDRIKIYIDGELQTNFSVAHNIAQNHSFYMNGAYAHEIAKRVSSTDYLNGYMSDAYLIDGQQLSASDFGQIDPATGKWIPKAYTGMYGTNGFKLDFSNAANLGADSSGNGNDWTVNGGVTQVSSTPTDAAATINALPPDTNNWYALSDGNRKWIANNTGPSSWASGGTTLSMNSGKWYVEFLHQGDAARHANDRASVGLANADFNPNTAYSGQDEGCYWHGYDGTIATIGGSSTNGGTLVVNDVVRFAVDFDTGKYWFAKNNNTWIGGGDPVAGTAPTGTLATLGIDYVFMISGAYNASYGAIYSDEADWTYSAPTGFSALSTANLPAVTDSVDNHFKTVTYTGDGTNNRSITGLGFQPDFVWYKNRSDGAQNHVWSDAVRGAVYELYSNTTSQQTGSGWLSSFDADGFTFGNANGANNAAANEYVAWTANLPNEKTSGWAGSPTITPTMEKYNADLGMSIVKYTGTGSSATFPHTLGTKPGMVMVKRLDSTGNWMTWHEGLTSGDGYAVSLNTTNAEANIATNFGAEPTSELVTVGTNVDTNASGGEYIAYIFAESDFIKIGSYTGNGNADGPMINAGIEPVWTMSKNASSAGVGWPIIDAVRMPYNNLPNIELSTETSAAEPSMGGGGTYDVLSNGIKLRNSRLSYNGSGNTHIYLMIGEPVGNPTGDTFTTTTQTITTTDSAQLSGNGWGDLDSVTVTETLNGGTIHYATSFDGRTTWKIWDDTASAWRSIARISNTIWQYNSGASGGETWTSCTTNTQEACLSQAFGVSANQMDSTAFAAISDANWNASGGWSAGVTVDTAVGITAASTAVTPSVDNIAYNYTTQPAYAAQLFTFDTSMYSAIGVGIHLTSFATASAGDGYQAKIWDATNTAWIDLDTLEHTASSMPTAVSYLGVTTNLSDYVDADGMLRFLIYSTNPSVSATDAVLSTDIMKLAVFGAIAPPAVATNLAVGQRTLATQTLSWTDNAANETGYRVYRSTSSGSGFAQIGSDLPADTTSYADSGLAADTNYYYKVTAYHDLGSIDSAELAAPTPLAILSPDSTTDLAYESTPADPDSITITDFQSTAFDTAGYTAVATDDSDYQTTTGSGSTGTGTANIPFTTSANYTVEDSTAAELATGTIALRDTSVDNYSISNAALFNGSTGYLSRTPSAGNRQTWTWSGLVKRSQIGSDQILFHAFTSTAGPDGAFQISFNAADELWIGAWSFGAWRVTNEVFRDPSKYLHIVVAVDTTQAVAADRIKLYIDGSEITSFSASQDPVQDSVLGLNQAATHYIGRNVTASYLNGYLSDTYFIDGQQLVASDFGGVDAATGKWIPKSYSGTYGTNGFKLDFSNAANLGEDSSGNNNDWTVSGGLSQVNSTPTDTYATLNPLAQTTGLISLSDGNKKMAYAGGGGYPNAYTSINPEGLKGYFEFDVETAVDDLIGFIPSSLRQSNMSYAEIGTYYYTPHDGAIKTGTGGSVSATIAGYLPVLSPGERGACAFDFTNGKRDVWFRNSTSWGNPGAGVGDPATGTNPALTSATLTADQYEILMAIGSTSGPLNFHAEVSDWTYAAPTGFSALSTANLPAVTDDVDNHFKTVTYTGNGTSQSITSLGYQPDFVWIKNRTGAYDHQIYDSVRGANKILYSNTTGTEGTATTEFTSFDADGFTVGSHGGTNLAANNYVAWTANLPNQKTSGWSGSPTITPTEERYNADLGMSIVKYTGNGTAGATIPHSLGVKPGMIIVKNLVNSTWDWTVYHESEGATKWGGLNLANAFSASGSMWNNTEPTADLVTLGDGLSVNTNGEAFIAYVFAESDFVKIGSYTGNGSMDGPMINEGIEPRFTMFKRSDSTGSWLQWDGVRDAYNEAFHALFPDLNSAESSSGAWAVDLNRTGVKMRNAQPEVNAFGGSYAYLMIGEPVGTPGGYSTTTQTITTNDNTQINTSTWSDLDSVTVTETLNGQNTYYAVSFDGRTTWKIWDGVYDNSWRSIVRNNVGTWERNGGGAGVTSWVPCTTNTQEGCLSEDFTSSSFKLTGSQLAAISDLNWNTTGGWSEGDTIDLATGLSTSSADLTPTVDNIAFNYSTAARYAAQMYSYDVSLYTTTQVTPQLMSFAQTGLGSSSSAVPYATSGNYAVENASYAEVTGSTATLKDTQGSGYQISNAALFDGSTGYLSWTPSGGVAPNEWIISTWVKRSTLGAQQTIMSAGNNTSNEWNLFFDTDDTLHAYGITGGATVLMDIQTKQVFRDPGDWVHIVLSVDVNQATAADRVRIWINGVEDTDLTRTTNPPTATGHYWNYTGTLHEIGRRAGNSGMIDSAYIAEISNVYGLSIQQDDNAITDFGETDTTTGKWIPKNYTGSYGTNGFKLDFSNAANIGADASGNGNDWTVNGTVTQVTSTPTDTYATWNPLSSNIVTGGTGQSITNGNRTAYGGAATGNAGYFTGTLEFGDQDIMAEFVVDALGSSANSYISVGTPSDDFGVYLAYRQSGERFSGGSWLAGWSAWSVNDVIRLEYTDTTGTLEVFLNNVSQGTITHPSAPAADLTWFAYLENGAKLTMRSAENEWTGTPSTGFKALSTANLPAVTDDVDNHWKTVTYTGNGSTQSITGLGYQPDFVWIKDRDEARSHQIYDSIRGSLNAIYPDLTTQEQSSSGYLASFDTDGFTVGSDLALNTNNVNYVAWTANLPSDEVNTDGDISVTWKYNADLGMAAGTYTGNATAGATLGLPTINGTAPAFFTIKNRTTASTGWNAYHSSLGATKYLKLNTTDAAVASAAYWNDTEPTSSVITLGTGAGNVNASGDSHVIYAFWETDFVKIGSYTGNGNADGPMINEGIEPAWSMIKSSSNAGLSWPIYDNARNRYNPATGMQLANTSDAEFINAAYAVDFVKNGLKIRSDAGNNHINVSGAIYTYLMIGEPTGTPGGYSTTTQTVTTNDNSQLSTSTWNDVDSVTVTETLNGQNIYYAVSYDARSTWKIWDSSDSSWRSITRNNSGTWQYNAAASGSITWTACSTNDQESCLSEAFGVSANQMSGTEMAAISDANWNATNGWSAGATIDLATGLSTSSAGTTPTVDGVTFNVTSDASTGLTAKIWNVNSSSWESLADLANSYAGMPTGWSEQDVSTNLSDYIDSGTVRVLVHTDNLSMASADTTLTTDLSKLAVWGAVAPPAQPTNVTSSRATNAVQVITWDDNANNEIGYKVLRSTTSGSGYTEIASLAANSTSYADSGLTADTDYYYKIQAYHTLGGADSAELASATALAVLTPDSTTDLAFESAPGDPGSLNLTDFEATAFDAAAYTAVGTDDISYKTTLGSGDTGTGTSNIPFTTSTNYDLESASTTEVLSGSAALKSGTTYTTATGGTITTDGDYRVHTFTSSGTFDVTQLGADNTIEYTVVAGGGGGGGATVCNNRAEARGGGGGGAVHGTVATSLGQLAVTVGAGGAGGAGYADGIDGGGSSLGAIASATGGGGGGKARREFGGCGATFIGDVGIAGSPGGGTGNGGAGTTGGGGGGAYGVTGGAGGTYGGAGGAATGGNAHGAPGSAYGGGGSGGSAWSSGSSTVNGGAGASGVVIIRYKFQGTVYPTNNINSITTNNNSQIDTSTWSDLDSVSITETLNGQNIYYATSFDGRTTWKTWDTADSSWRSIVRNNSGTWQYNSAASGSMTWTACATQTQESCLSEAFGVAANQMSGTTMTAISDANWNATNGWTAGNTIDLAAGLLTSSADLTPTLDNFAFNYSTAPRYAAQLYTYALDGYSLTKITPQMIAYATANAGNGLTAKIWNSNTNAWDTLTGLANTASDMPADFSEHSISANISDYLDAGKLRVLLYSNNPSVSGVDAALSADLAQLSIWGVLINQAPNAPMLVSPANTSFLNDNTPTLSANYSDSDTGDAGTTEYRIASTNAADCLANANIVASGSSSATANENEDTIYTPGSSIGGDATYYWCARNNDGIAQSSWTSMGSFTLDTAAPTSTNITIDGGAYIASTTAALTLAATGASEMYITNTATCSGGGSWESYATSKAGWTLGESNATATVYVKYRDAAGNESSCINDSIVHDNTDPVLAITDDAAGSWGTSDDIIATATEANANQMKYYYDADGVCSASVGDYVNTYTSGATISVTTDHSDYICFYADDLAGNTATIATAQLMIDTGNPDIVAVDAGASNADRLSLTSGTWFRAVDIGSDDQASFSWTDPASGSNDTFYYELSGVATADQIVGDETSTTNAWADDVTLSEGTNYFHARGRSGAGTWSTERVFVVNYDKTAPTTSAAVTAGTLGSNSWYTTDATVTITPADAHSGIASTVYCVDQSDSCTPATAYTVPVVISTEDTNYIRYASTDTAGNVQATQSLTVKVDKTAPTIQTTTLTSPNGSENWGGNTAHPITWTTGDITDATSGFASITLQYSTDGTNYTDITTGEVNDGSYTWTTADLDSSTVTVRIIAIDAAGLTASDTSDANFSLTQTTTMTTVELDTGNHQLGGINETLSDELRVRVGNGFGSYAGAGDVVVTFDVTAAPTVPAPAYPGNTAFIAGATGGQSHTSIDADTWTVATDTNGYAALKFNTADRAGIYTVRAYFGDGSGTKEVFFTITEREVFQITLSSAAALLSVDPITTTTDAASSTFTITTNAASFALATTPTQWLRNTAYNFDLANWVSSLGFAWDNNDAQATPTSFSEAAGSPDQTTLYSCSGDACQGTINVTLDLTISTDYANPAGTYTNTLPIEGVNIVY